jgi:uncharacterized protein (UPF0332 family)
VSEYRVALEVARREKTAGPAAAVNRAYYACFYAAGTNPRIAR